ncbi:MAG: hypothetical protein ACFFAY_13430 [Promethearchaeota archaeon]
MKKSKMRVLYLVFIVIMLAMVPHSPTLYDTVNVMPSTVEITPVLSAEVWSDNFDDENISDWDIYGVNITADPWCIIPGDYSAEGGVLRAVGQEWNHAAHNSSVAYGTWTFDVDVQDPVDEYHFAVAFMMKAFNKSKVAEFVGIEGYVLFFYTREVGQQDIRLLKGLYGEPHRFEELDRYYEDNLIGWHNIIVTRELSGQFYVYLDGEVIIGNQDSFHTTSEVFNIYTHAGPALDNITVSDTIDYDKAPPEFSHRIVDKTIVAGTQFYYDLNATDYSGIDQWWLNDTANFAIDDEGVITSITDLTIGEYAVSVGVNDTLGNTRTTKFTLTVEQALSGFPVESIVLSIGVVAVVVTVVVWRIRKR